MSTLGGLGGGGSASGSGVGKGVLLSLLGAATAGVVGAATIGGLVGAEASRCPTDGGKRYVSQEPSEEAASDIPKDYLDTYRQAGEQYGIDWAILAAIGDKETDHGRGGMEGPGTAYGSAKGPMQFIDSTFETVGVDGDGDGARDVFDPEDAIPSAANYLKGSGAPDDYYSALLQYNGDDAYVQDVMNKAEEYRAAGGGDTQGLGLVTAPATEALSGFFGTRPAFAQEEGSGNDGRAALPLPEEHMGSYADDWGGSRPSGQPHDGTDIFAPEGTPIYSTVKGVVEPAFGQDDDQWNDYGGYVTQVRATEDAGPIKAGDRLLYAHQAREPLVGIGEEVQPGQQIGHVGNTGYSPNPGDEGPFDSHLHFGWFDPTGERSESATGAMNPYPMLGELKGNRGTSADEESGTLAPGACKTPGQSGSVSPGSGDAEELIANPNFQADPQAIEDLRAGIVDPRLVAALQAVTEEHQIYVPHFKEGHAFLPGVVDGPTIPDGYGAAGGLPNTHYFGRAVDIFEVDGKPVQGNGGDPDVQDVARILEGLPAQERPDQMIGPGAAYDALGATREKGYITEPDQVALHEDHWHLGFMSEEGTNNVE